MLKGFVFRLVCLVLISTLFSKVHAYTLDSVAFNLTENVLENPEETGPYLEGDIKDDNPIYRHLAFQRNGILSASMRWPHGIVPYIIRGSFSSQQLSIIHHAFNEYHKNTCIRFQRHRNEHDYVVITDKAEGCWSSVGRMGGEQVVNLESPKCFSNYGTTIHELMHVLGFYHEQNRYERDNYVRVLEDNVKAGMMANFQKLPFSSATSFGVQYDYASVMHYKSTSFSKNGKPTLIALKPSPDVAKMGQRSGFSPGDIKKINSMYKCY
ncbi:zinc metalloproteinase nas-14 [Musca vetustissima]|uniref:zinc metalloproteinase nas-14 n=1 Tax=Musca vetustissima TaxID=27455 RepID=UPI002AB64F0C|nr:zinc metalloproteinase nas-14 [Musca vetustissima]